MAKKSVRESLVLSGSKNSLRAEWRLDSRRSTTPWPSLRSDGSEIGRTIWDQPGRASALVAEDLPGYPQVRGSPCLMIVVRLVTPSYESRERATLWRWIQNRDCAWLPRSSNTGWGEGGVKGGGNRRYCQSLFYPPQPRRIRVQGYVGRWGVGVSHVTPLYPTETDIADTITCPKPQPRKRNLSHYRLDILPDYGLYIQPLVR